MPASIRLAPTGLIVLAAAGVAAGGWIRAPAWPVAVAALLCAAVAARLIASRSPTALALVGAAIALAGTAWGSARVVDREPGAVVVASRAVTGEIVLTGPSRPGPAGRVEVRGAVRRLPGLDAGDRLLVSLGREVPARSGSVVRVQGRIAPPASPQAPVWWRRFLAREGIAGRLSVTRAEVVGRRGGLVGTRDRWREWVRARVAREIDGEARALVRGMAVGAVDELTEETAEELRASGLWHLVAVSGQNVMVVAIAVLALATLLGVGRRAGAGVAIAAVCAYCLACDGGASVGRAGVMGIVGLLATIAGSPRRGWHALALGLLVLLAWSPASITDPGLQLSFAATAGLIGLSGPVATLLAGWVPGPLAMALAQSLAAGLATAPVLVWDFGEISPIGILAGLVAVPIAGPVVVASLAGVAAGAAHPALGVFADTAAGLGAEAVLAVASAASRLPGAGTAVTRAVAVPLVLVAVAPRVATWWLSRPDRRVDRRRSRRPVALVVGAALAAAPGLACGRSDSWPVAPTVTALDIGQGDAILLRDPNGAAVLVDAGPAGDPPPILGALRRNGVRRLDALILTHAQSDHIGGAEAILQEVPVDLLAVPPLPEERADATRVISLAGERGTGTLRPLAGAVITAGTWRVTTLLPARAPGTAAEPNAAGLVALASAGALDVLLTADVEGGTLARADLRDVDVLKVSHHGSADPALGTVLDRARPEVALVSVGPNGYGHPTADTLAALARAGVVVRRTDLSGDVSVEMGEGGLSVRAAR